MNIFDQLVEIAEITASETRDSDRPFFTHNKNDLFEIDRDILENDSQAGDTYVWALKSNGCGTYLIRCGSDFESITLQEAGPESHFYLIQCTDINEGSIKKIDFDKALKASVDYKEPKGRVPRRKRLYEQLNEMLGLDKSTGTLDKTLMGSEFWPLKGDKSLIRLSKGESADIRVEVLRTKMNPPGRYEPVTQKPQATYHAPITPESLALLNDGPKFLMVESDKNGFATLKETVLRTFTIAKRKLEKRHAEPSASM